MFRNRPRVMFKEQLLALCFLSVLQCVPALRGSTTSTSQEVLTDLNFAYYFVNHQFDSSLTQYNGLTLPSDLGVDQDFIVSDLALLPALGADFVAVPLFLTPLAVAVNVPGVASGALVLDLAVLAEIYLGTVTSWNDTKIRTLNPTLTLPASTILVGRPSASSAQALCFTQGLSKASSVWASSVGSGLSVSWPVAATGESGCTAPPCRGFTEPTGLALAAHVLAVPGSIAFSSLLEVTQSAANLATLLNPSRRGVLPSWGSALASADGLISLAAPLAGDLPNPVCSLASSSYPLVYLEKMYLRKTPRKGGPSCSELAVMSDYLNWISTADVPLARVRAQGFSTLPTQLLGTVKSTLQQTFCNRTQALMAADPITTGPSTLVRIEVTATSTLGLTPLGLLTSTYSREQQTIGVSVNAQRASSFGFVNLTSAVTPILWSDSRGIGQVAASNASLSYVSGPVLGVGIVPFYNMPEVVAYPDSPLVLTRAALGGILSGSITMWNDSVLQAANPRIAALLPAKAIIVISPQPSSAEAVAMADFLSVANQSPQTVWSNVTATSVSETVGATPYALGYGELSPAIARSQSSRIASMVNRRGETVSANTQSLSIAATSAKLAIQAVSASQYALLDSDTESKGGWPIVRMMFLSVAREWASGVCSNATSSTKFWVWMARDAIASKIAVQASAVIPPLGPSDNLLSTLQAVVCKAVAATSPSEMPSFGSGPASLAPVIQDIVYRHDADLPYFPLSVRPVDAVTNISNALQTDTFVISDEKLTVPSTVTKFPLFAMAVVPMINLRSIGAGSVVLTADQMMGIFNGSIACWNSPLLTQSNSLLASSTCTPIRPVICSNAASPASTALLLLLTSKDGVTTAVKSLPQTSTTLVGATDSQVAAIVAATPGAIGVAAFSQMQSPAVACSLINRAGRTVTASSSSVYSSVVSGVDATSVSPLSAYGDTGSSGGWPMITIASLYVKTNVDRAVCAERDSAVQSLLNATMPLESSTMTTFVLSNLPPNVLLKSQSASISALSCAGVVGGSLVSFKSQPLQINGQGATFPANLYSTWVFYYSLHKPSVQINYLATGSGAGQTAIISRSHFFAGSDALLSDAQYTQGADLQMFPLIAGAVVFAFNLPGVNAQLVVDCNTLAKIFLGSVTRWNDASLAALNPGVTLPDVAITVIVRSDKSGTTEIFAKTLSINSEWNTIMGPNSLLNWTNSAARQLTVPNNGLMGALIVNTPYSIGYTTLDFANQFKLAMFDMVNVNGKTVRASASSVKAAMASGFSKLLTSPKLTADLMNQPGDQAWPASSFTYFIIRMVNPGDCTLALELQSFFLYLLDDQGMKSEADRLGFAVIPSSVATLVRAKLRQMKCGGALLSYEPCQPGTVTLPDHTCSACPLGTYTSSSGATVCVSCATGTYAATTGMSFCADCAPGTISANVASSSCSVCPVGYSSSSYHSSSCSICAKGTFSATPSSPLCQKCIAGYYLDKQGGTACLTCPAYTTSYPAASSIEECTCINGYFNKLAKGGIECALCPEGASCGGGLATPVPVDGYWGNLDSPFEFVNCKSKDQGCPGGTFVCGEGYKGKQCYSCSSAHFKLMDGAYCYSCASVFGTKYVFATVLFIIALIVVWNMLHWITSGLIDSFDMVMQFLQLLAFTGNINMNWGSSSDFYFSIANITTFSVDIISLDCLNIDWTYIHGWALQLTLPWIIAVIYMLKTLGRLIWLRIRFHGVTSEQRSRHYKKELQGFVRSVILYLDLLHPELTSKSLQPFFCQTVLGEKVLTAYPELVCWQGTHSVMVGIACLCVLVYVIGIPVGVFYLLRKAHAEERLMAQDFMHQYHNLYMRYNLTAYYWQPVVMGRNVLYLLTILAFSQLPMLQLIMCCAVLNLSFSFHLLFKPYRETIVNFAVPGWHVIMIGLVMGGGLRTMAPNTASMSTLHDLSSFGDGMVKFFFILSLLSIALFGYRAIRAKFSTMLVKSKLKGEMGGDQNIERMEWDLVQPQIMHKWISTASSVDKAEAMLLLLEISSSRETMTRVQINWFASLGVAAPSILNNMAARDMEEGELGDFSWFTNYSMLFNESEYGTVMHWLSEAESDRLQDFRRIVLRICRATLVRNERSHRLKSLAMVVTGLATPRTSGLASPGALSPRASHSGFGVFTPQRSGTATPASELPLPHPLSRQGSHNDSVQSVLWPAPSKVPSGSQASDSPSKASGSTATVVHETQRENRASIFEDLALPAAHPRPPRPPRVTLSLSRAEFSQLSLLSPGTAFSMSEQDLFENLPGMQEATLDTMPTVRKNEDETSGQLEDIFEETVDTPVADPTPP